MLRHNKSIDVRTRRSSRSLKSRIYWKKGIIRVRHPVEFHYCSSKKAKFKWSTNTSVCTIKPTYYIPDRPTNQIFDSLYGAKIFQYIRLIQCTLPVWIKKEHKKCTQCTRDGKYEFERMGFGLCGCPFSFLKNDEFVIKRRKSEIVSYV